jgi:hypothetical protein
MASGSNQAQAFTGGKRQAATAFGLFAALCLAGILTLFSQVSFEKQKLGGSGSTWTSLDPGTAEATGLDDLMPSAIEWGASPAGAKDIEAPKPPAEGAPAPKILRLR